MSGLLGGGSPKIVQQPAPIVQSTAVEQDASNAGMFARMRRLSAYGRSKTDLTGGATLSSPVLERKTLLGVG
jgi:hypothetical protein